NVDPQEFVAVMAPSLFQAAAFASHKRSSVLIRKSHESVPGSEAEPDRASRVDILSDVDLAIQEMLVNVISQHWPFVGVIAEEDTPLKAKFQGSSATFCVLIDPVDGTKNYLKGDSRYCHIVSLTRHQEMLATLLYSHSTDRLFVAVRG